MNELETKNAELLKVIIVAEDALGWILLSPHYLEHYRHKVEAAVTMARKVIDESRPEDGSADFEPVCTECGLSDEVATMQEYGFDYFCQRCNHGWDEVEDE
jgi:hypothetical protein